MTLRRSPVAVLLPQKVANALPDEPDKPKRDGNLTVLPAALEINCENATTAVDLWQIANEYDASFRLLKHSVHSPRSNAERLEVEPQKLNRGNTVTALPVDNQFDFRPAVGSLRPPTKATNSASVRPGAPSPEASGRPVPSNDNWHPLEAA